MPQSCTERVTSWAEAPQQWLQFVTTQPEAGGEATAELGNGETEANKLNVIPTPNTSADQRPAEMTGTQKRFEGDAGGYNKNTWFKICQILQNVKGAARKRSAEMLARAGGARCSKQPSGSKQLPSPVESCTPSPGL